MKKHAVKEPRKIIAAILLIYIVWASFMIYRNLHEESNTKEVTGFSSTGTITLNLVSKCNIPLKEGFNHISLCANVSNTSALSVLQNIQGKYDFVLRLNTTSQEFQVFSPSSGENEFDTIEGNQSYFIYANQNTTLNIFGSEFDDMSIPLSTEFTPAPYPFVFSANISKYIQPIEENTSFVLIWNVTRQEFQIFSPEAAVQEIDRISRGQGQYVFSTTGNTILYLNKTALNGS